MLHSTLVPVSLPVKICFAESILKEASHGEPFTVPLFLSRSPNLVQGIETLPARHAIQSQSGRESEAGKVTESSHLRQLCGQL